MNSQEKFKSVQQLRFSDFNSGLETITKLPENIKSLRVNGKSLKLFKNLNLENFDLEVAATQEREIVVENCKVKWLEVEDTSETTSLCKVIFKNCKFGDIHLRKSYKGKIPPTVIFEKCVLTNENYSGELGIGEQYTDVRFIDSLLHLRYLSLKSDSVLSLQRCTLKSDQLNFIGDENNKIDYGSLNLEVNRTVQIHKAGEFEEEDLVKILSKVSKNKLEDLVIYGKGINSLHFLDGLCFDVDCVTLNNLDDVEDFTFALDPSSKIRKIIFGSTLSKAQSLNGLYVKDFKEIHLDDFNKKYQAEIKKCFDFAPTSSTGLLPKPEFVTKSGHLDVTGQKLQEAR